MSLEEKNRRWKDVVSGQTAKLIRELCRSVIIYRSVGCRDDGRRWCLLQEKNNTALDVEEEIDNCYWHFSSFDSFREEKARNIFLRFDEKLVKSQILVCLCRFKKTSMTESKKMRDGRRKEIGMIELIEYQCFLFLCHLVFKLQNGLLKKCLF